MDTLVSTFITASTMDDELGGAFIPTIGSSFPSSWDVFWQSALVYIGFLLVLAFFLARRPVLRWTFAVLYGLWMLYTTTLALSFVATLQAANTGSYVVTSPMTWWEQLVQIDVDLSGRSDPLSPAWGYWLYIGALVVSWLALGLLFSTLLRGRNRRATRAGGDQPASRRRMSLAASLVTVGSIIWVTSLAALPMLVTDCRRPLGLPTPTLGLLCRSEQVLHPLQESAYGVIVSAFPATYNTAATFDLAGNEILRMVAYFLDFGLLVLAIAAVPLVLVAVWRPQHQRREAAAWVSIWAALVLFETGFLFHVLATLLSQPIAGNVFMQSVGPGAFLVPLGAVLITAGVVWYLLQLRRKGGLTSST
jgi:hypothetical protein